MKPDYDGQIGPGGKILVKCQWFFPVVSWLIYLQIEKTFKRKSLYTVLSNLLAVGSSKLLAIRFIGSASVQAHPRKVLHADLRKVNTKCIFNLRDCDYNLWTAITTQPFGRLSLTSGCELLMSSLTCRGPLKPFPFYRFGLYLTTLDHSFWS